MFYFSHGLIYLIDSKRHYACESTCLREGTAERKVNTAIKWPSVAKNMSFCAMMFMHKLLKNNFLILDNIHVINS